MVEVYLNTPIDMDPIQAARLVAEGVARYAIEVPPVDAKEDKPKRGKAKVEKEDE